MALNPNTDATMAGRVTAPDANFPYGSSKNESSPGAGDGTPYFKGRADDIFGFQQALLDEANIVPSGNADNATTSQYKEALRTITNMTTVTHNMASDANYTLTAVQNRSRRIIITDTGVNLTTGRNIVVDTMQKQFILKNETLQTLTVVISGDSVSVIAGAEVNLYNNGTDISMSSVLTGSKNKLINPNGLVNQRLYVSGTPTTGANEYTLDRWRVITLGEALVFSTSNNKTTFTAPLNGVEQVIEGNGLQSGTYVISGLLTATCAVDGVAKVNGDTFTVVGGTNVSVKFFNGTFALPQIEAGTKVTNFEERAFVSEELLCLRYYEAGSIFMGSASYQLVGNWFHFSKQFLVRKRVTPTMTVGDGSVTATTDFLRPNGAPSVSAFAGFTADAEL